MSLVLVTGASGHIGSHICRVLLDREHSVRALVRPTSRTEHLEELGVELVEGDVLQPDSLGPLVKGVESVFHAAAVYSFSEGPGEDLIVRTAVEGTHNLYQACRGSRVGRIVFTSSVVTLGMTDDPSRPLDESGRTEDVGLDYYRAKLESEDLALALAAEMDLPTVVCLPSQVVGAGDHRLTPSNAALLEKLRGRPVHVAGGQCLVDVRDVAEGHVLALERGRPGERYILGGENLSNRDLLVRLRRAAGKSFPVLPIPTLLLQTAALGFELLGKVTGSTPLLTRERVRRGVGRYAYYDSGKARSELGFSPRRADEFLPEALDWLREHHGDG